MRILVLGDSYCPNRSLRPALEALPGHEVTFLDVTDEPGWRPVTASEQRVRELLGSPAQVIAALDGHDVLVVQAAPVTAEVMDACPQLKLVCVARGGPVNVDLDGGHGARHPGRDDARQERHGRRRADHRGHGHRSRDASRRRCATCTRTASCSSTTTKAPTGSATSSRATSWASSASGRSAARRGAGPGLRHARAGQRPLRGGIGGRVPAGLEPVELDELLAAADLVSLHARATAENRGLMDAAPIRRA